MQEPIDQIRINLGDSGLLVMNISLAVIMFGVALELSGDDFRRLLKNPKSALVGLCSQFLILPALTFLLVVVYKPDPSVALGMFMVAACPGGNISNFFSVLAKENAALSVSMTAVATLLAIIMTPFNFSFWAGLYGPTNIILKDIYLNIWEIFKIIALILGLPIILGMAFRQFKSTLAEKISSWIKGFGILFFAGFVIVAFSMNFTNFLNYIHVVIILVFVHNAIALGSGYGLAAACKLSRKDRKSIAIETGIQNSGLGLLLIFTFFSGRGGMALVAAWWGVWHIIAGLSVAWYWSKGKLALQRLLRRI